MSSLAQVNSVFQFVEHLQMEANAIRQAAKHLEHAQVEQALNLLHQCSGKVVLVGVGKSGIVARKVAATLTSIGIVSVFLHPCDALHGDLGVIMKSDAVVLFSNSGETEELLQMLPHLKHRQVSLIAVVGNCNSTLARHADAVLDASVDREACPLNLAPTTSTTVALAIGDALAMTLMQLRGTTSEDFAFNHPAGRLGKRLTLKVSDLMQHGSDNPTLPRDASWLEVVAAITQGGAGAVNIIDENHSLLGLITDGDLRRCVQKTAGRELENLIADHIMTPNPVTVFPETLAYDALKRMEDRPSQISVLPVVDLQHHCIGLIRLHDLLRSGL